MNSSPPKANLSAGISKYEKTYRSRSLAGPDITEFTSSGAKHLFDGPTNSLHLAIKREPEMAWETDMNKWVCANEFGAKFGDNKDDTAAIQRAIDDAAAAKKTVVYLRGTGGGDPNWYNINGEVRVHGSVRLIIGLGFGRVIGGTNGAFVVDHSSAPVVKFQNLQAFGGKHVAVENRSAKNTLVVEGCDLKIVGAGVRFKTSDAGRTEVFGMFNYGPGNLKKDDARPMFDIDNASFSIAGLREINFGGATYPIKVRERRGEVSRTLGSDKEGGWIGWSLFSGWPGPAR